MEQKWIIITINNEIYERLDNKTKYILINKDKIVVIDFIKKNLYKKYL